MSLGALTIENLARAKDASAKPDYPTPTWLKHLLERLSCPKCYGELGSSIDGLRCGSCGATYASCGNGIVDLRPASFHQQSAVDWSKHWSDEKQRNLSQRFFSFYRKAVFARTVSYFVERYFPAQGVFVEAGSGTSESSMRIDKRDGGRLLVATDLIGTVLADCHPVMDARLCADIFRLPFKDESLDGIWNVGVMEHFTQREIDQLMAEFHRVLRPGAPLLLLWPGATSLPQKMLRLTEKLINLRRDEEFHFHPDEISQLKSSAEARKVLARNNFDCAHIDPGWRSLMAFKTVVATKKTRRPDRAPTLH